MGKELPPLGTKEGWATERARACATLAAGILKDGTVERPAGPRELAVAKKWLREALEALDDIGVPEWKVFLDAEYEKRLVAQPVDAPGSNPGSEGSNPS